MTQNRPRKAKKNRKTRSTQVYLDEFFSQYPTFDYDPSEPVMSEFYRMCDFFDWDKDDFEKTEARGLLKDALTQQFNSIYGTDVNSIESWQTLCRVLGIAPMPEGLHACRGVSAPQCTIRTKTMLTFFIVR
jgi:hypothetical protein